jgi:thiol-disulfide isomerase/thioredoxin/Tfp pilus assembly protein PilF
LCLAAAALLFLTVTPPCQADDAKEHIQKGDAFLANHDSAKAIAEFRAAIGVAPDSVEAHRKFMRATQNSYLEASDFSKAANFEDLRRRMDGAYATADEKLREIYEQWAQQHPDKAIYQWALGTLWRGDSEKSQQYFQKALALDPKFAPAADSLGGIAEMCGDEATAGRYFSQAAADDPADIEARFRYVETFENTDLQRYRQLTEEFVHRFPNYERTSQALVYLADRLEGEEEKIHVLEELRALVPQSKLHGYGMDELFGAYARTNPEKALALAQDLAKQLTEPYNVKRMPAEVAYAKSLVTIRSLIDNQKYLEAQNEASKTVDPKDLDPVPLKLLKAEAQERSGDPGAAYRGLVAVAAKNPDSLVKSAVVKYGAEIHKSADQAEADIWQARERDAQPVKDFELKNYATGKNVKLSDYQGKVVLLNFFFPTCHTCRGEFPFLQKLHAEYAPDKFVILAVNIEPTEDTAVLPLFKNLRVDFIPLKSPTGGWAEVTFDIHAAPVNMLIDQGGRLVFKPELGSSYAQKDLEHSISELVALDPTPKRDGAW